MAMNSHPAATVMMAAGAGRTAKPAWVAASIISVFAVSTASWAQPQVRPPTAVECSTLIRMAQDDAQWRRMTREQLDRTSVCLNLMKKSQSATTQSAPIKIFRN